MRNRRPSRYAHYAKNVYEEYEEHMRSIHNETQTAIPDAAGLLRQWQTRMLDGLLIVLSIVGLLAAIGGSWSDYNVYGAEAIPLIIAYTVMYAIVLVIALVKQLGYTVRAIVLLGIVVVLGAFVLVSDGLLGSGRLIWMAIVVLTAALFGVRGGVIAIVISLVWFSIVGWLYTQGILVSAPARITVLDTPPSWIGAVAVYVCMTCLAAVPFMYLLNRLSTLASSATTNAARAEANARLAEERAAELERQTVRLQETEHMLRTLIATLETPTVPLASGVLLAPIVGQLDSRRAEALVHRLLTVASAERTRLMVIDIAGVPAFDTQVAQSLLHAAQALELIGCRVALTGISPTTAQTITALGIRMDNIMIARSPQDILAQR
jgi:rsbT co-antagonist protein RsbR